MMLENALTASVESNVTNHTSLVNKTSQSVTQNYVDKVKNTTSMQASINQITRLKNIRISGNASIEILKEGSIQASLIAQNMVSNSTTDRTNLAAVMSTSMKQAVESQAELDTAQKAVNVMEQMDQNNGGIEGVVAKLADTVTNVFGGGNSEQDIKNTVNTSLKQNVNNNLNMENVIETELVKNFNSDTLNECKQDLNINQITEMENIDLSGNASIKDTQKASLDSAVHCFNEVFNIRNISTEMTTASGQDADQALSAIAGLKAEQDVKNDLKQTKLQKNFLDSMGGSCAMIVIAVVLIGGMGAKGGGKGSGGPGGKSKKMMGGIFGFFIIVFIIGVIVLLVKHKEAFAGTPLGDALDQLEQLNPSARLLLEGEQEGDIMLYRILDGKTDMKLVASTERASSESTVEPLPAGAKSLEFRNTEDDTKFIFEEIEQQQTSVGTTQSPRQENEPEPKKFKIFTSDRNFQLGLLYSDNVRNDGDKIIVEPILYPNDNNDKFIFTTTPELDPTNINELGYIISHVNIKNEDTDPDDHDLEDNMVGSLQASDKPLNGGLFRDVDFEIKGAEFRFS